MGLRFIDSLVVYITTFSLNLLDLLAHLKLNLSQPKLELAYINHPLYKENNQHTENPHILMVKDNNERMKPSYTKSVKHAPTKNNTPPQDKKPKTFERVIKFANITEDGDLSIHGQLPLGSNNTPPSKLKDDGSYVLTFRLRLLSLITFFFLVLIVGTGYYTNSNNPLIDLIRINSTPVFINISGKDGALIYGLEQDSALRYQFTGLFGSSTRSENNISNNFSNDTIYALIALHSVIQDKHNNLQAYRNRSDDTVIGKALSGIGNIFSTSDNITDNVNILPPLADQTFKEVSPDTELDPTELILSDNLIPTGDRMVRIMKTYEFVDALANTLDVRECPSINSINDFVSYTCEYSYPLFLVKHYIASGAYSTDIVSTTIDLFPKLRETLLLGWLGSNLNLEDFINILFNSGYFDNNIMGIGLASANYLKVQPNEIDLPGSIFLMMLLYQNNKSIYPNFDITYMELLNKLVAMDYIQANQVQAIHEQILSFNTYIERISLAYYANDLFGKAYNLAQTKRSASIKSTFIGSTHNAASATIVNILKNYDIPSSAFMILDKEEVVSTSSFSITDNAFIKFYDDLPDIRVYNLLKPFLYYALLDNNIDLPRDLLDFKYQNIIFSYKQFLLSKHNNAQKEMSQMLEVLSKTDLDIVSSDLRVLFAEQLTEMEEQLFSMIQIKNYQSTLNNLLIPTATNDITDLFDTKTKVPFLSLIKAYSTFTNNGQYLNNKYILQINDVPVEQESSPIYTLNLPFLNLMKSNFFNSMQIRGSNQQYKYILDFQAGVAFSEKYTIIVWFGDLDNEDGELKDYSVNIESALQEIIKILG